MTDYWLNFITQVPLTDETRVTTNTGSVFAGNTSSGVVGIQTRRGHVYTGGVSLLRDLSARLTLGGEAYGGIADTSGLGRSQLQGLAGGMYAVKNGFTVTFAVLGGKYEASPWVRGRSGSPLISRPFSAEPAQIPLLPVNSKLICLQYRISPTGEFHEF